MFRYAICRTKHNVVYFTKIITISFNFLITKVYTTNTMYNVNHFYCKAKEIFSSITRVVSNNEYRYCTTILLTAVTSLTNRGFSFICSLPKKKIKYWLYDFESMWNHFLKKYIYTINHKRLALNYMYFTIFSGLSGALLASFIRLELAYPGSHFFKGDSVRYIQVISSHGLVMIFYVVIPIVFGLFANYFIPFHILAKDVSFPRLNSVGFWLLPAGFLLMAKPAFTRRQVYKFWDPYDAYKSVTESIITNFVEIMSSNDYGVDSVKHAVNYSHLNEIFQSTRGLSTSAVMTNYWGELLKSYTNFNLRNQILSSITHSYGCSTENKIDLFFSKLKVSNSPINSVYLVKKILLSLGEVMEVSPYNVTLADAIKGRMSNSGKNSLDLVQGWTDFLLLWEVNHLWYENPWQTLRHALRNKTIVMRNEKCSSPTSVMSGWTFITPFSSQTRFTGFGAQDAAILSVVFAGISTTISFTNLLITRRVLSAPGFRNRKNIIPFISISLFLVMRMLALITPVLGAAMTMLMLDRHWSTSFFDYAYGGDSILFHHLFWFFGHPEVYVVIIPAFGIVNSFLPHYNRRRIASKNHLVWATYVMAYMGFLVWGHHMYLVGLDHRSRSLYSTITVMISLPAVVKIVNWTLTLLNGVLNVDISLYFVISFLMFFLSGGLTGLWLSHVGLNIFVHDTFYVVAHFHFMFSCATFSAIFAGFYFYYKEFFGIEYSRVVATSHYIYWTLGQWITFMPLYWVGYNGLPRRYHDYPVMYMGWHGMSTSGHLLTMISIFIFFFGIVESKLRKAGIVPTTHGIPRTFKRSQYYLLKSAKIQSIDHSLPRFCIQNNITNTFL